MKKCLCVFIIFLMLLPMTVTAWTIPGIPVPYAIDYDFATGDEYYRIETMTDLYRLLDLSKQMRKENLGLVLAGVEESRVNNAVQSFGEENKELIFQESPYPIIPGITGNTEWLPCSVTHDDITSRIQIRWKKVNPENWQTTWPKYKAVPVIESIDELCLEAEKCAADIYYDKVFCISEKLLTAETYKESKVDTLIAAVKEKSGADISGFLVNYTIDYDTTPNTILIQLRATTKNEREKMAREERYNRILKNNLLLPLTDDMTELEKLTVIVNSASNIYNSYMITDTLVSYQEGKEISYSQGLGQCYHYAMLIQELCNLFGFECVYVSGSHGGDHAWNAVKYNGNWYMLDRTADRVKGYDVTLEDLSIYLYSEQTMEQKNYVWDKSKYPRCTSPDIIIDREYAGQGELSETTHKISMFEPYHSPDPISSGTTIYYDIWFDTETCAIVAIDSNLSSDSFFKENGEWKVKETVLRFPSEVTVGGKTYKVKTIGPHIDRFRRIGSYDHIYIPDGVTVTDFAYGVVNVRPLASTLHIGDNVTMGYGSMPSLHNPVEAGENFVYKGGFPHANYASVDELNVFNQTAAVSWGETENLVVPEGTKYVNYFVGNNILDTVPAKTLKLPASAYYIDPRLNRLNRKFIVADGSEHYTAIDGVLYNKDMTRLVSVPVGVKSIDIPDTVTEIGEYAFGYCNEIQEIVVPASVKSVGNNAFWHLSNIKTIYFEGEIPDSFSHFMCGDVKVISLAAPDKARIQYTIDDNYCLTLNGVPEKGRAFTVFYNTDGEIMKIGTGAEVKIPRLAKRFDVFVWDERMKPYDIKKSVDL